MKSRFTSDDIVEELVEEMLKYADFNGDEETKRFMSSITYDDTPPAPVLPTKRFSKEEILALEEQMRKEGKL